MKHNRLEKEENSVAALRREAGIWLRERRIDARLTQRDLAKLLSMEYYTFISQIESGRGRVPPEKYRDYADALRVDRRDFATMMLKFYDHWTYDLIFGGPKTARQTQTLAHEMEERLKKIEDAIARVTNPDSDSN